MLKSFSSPKCTFLYRTRKISVQTQMFSLSRFMNGCGMIMLVVSCDQMGAKHIGPDQKVYQDENNLICLFVTSPDNA